MDKRRFLTATAAGAAAALAASPSRSATPDAASARPARGPTLLTVTGAIGAGNRGPFDPALDQLMAKQKLSFTKAQTFDFAALTALPAVTIRPMLEYDAKVHALAGPLLLDVMKASGARIGDRSVMFVRAIDGYAAQITGAQANERRFILATHLDGRPMALGGLGPLWTIYDADRFPDMAGKPLPDRFGSCPWATYHVDVREG